MKTQWKLHICPHKNSCVRFVYFGACKGFEMCMSPVMLALSILRLAVGSCNRHLTRASILQQKIQCLHKFQFGHMHLTNNRSLHFPSVQSSLLTSFWALWAWCSGTLQRSKVSWDCIRTRKKMQNNATSRKKINVFCTSSSSWDFWSIIKFLDYYTASVRKLLSNSLRYSSVVYCFNLFAWNMIIICTRWHETVLAGRGLFPVSRPVHPNQGLDGQIPSISSKMFQSGHKMSLLSPWRCCKNVFTI